jgi:asparagine synthase (glutamine-hydrolysing)
MLRYFAIVRLDESAAARDAYRRVSESALAQHRDFALAYQAEAACVLYHDTVPGRIRIHALGRDGVIIGTLFRATGGATGPISSLSPMETGEVTASGGEILVRRHWGQYVALMKATGRGWRVIRDPTGGFPCYFVCCERIAVIFSHLGDCAPFLAMKLSINYSHLHASLQLHRFVARDTGFNEVEVVHAGEAVDLGAPNLARTCLWNPISFCTSPREHEDIEENIVRMRELVMRCISSWAACRRSILHELSGGLDSSIVLACLATAPSAPRLACCTHVTDSPEGDERYYAHLMARHVRVPLIELPLRPKAWNRIEDLVRVRDPVSPLFTAFRCGEDSEIEGALESGSFDCTFSGQGGDHLFHRILPSITAADYARVHGLSTGLFRVIVETARLSRQPIWDIARRALEYGYLRRAYDPSRELRVPGFICAPPVDVPRSCHPWLAHSTHLPPAKALQVMCLTEAQTYFATPRPYADEIHPLISQPLVEFCLQVPTYILSHGGTDRAIARAAFRDALPPEISQRSSKGAVNQFFFKAVFGNRDRIRPFLMDGLLAERGLLDRSALQRSLDDPVGVARGHSLMPIMTAVICEMWLRNATSLVHTTGLSAAA